MDFDELLSGSLAMDLRMPVDCEAIDALPPAHRLERLAGRNITVLRAIAVLENEPPEHEDDSGISGELARIEIKVDLMVGLLADVLALQRPSPPEQEIRLGMAGVVFTQTGRRWKPGDLAMLSLFVHPSVPRPVQWPVHVVLVRDEGDGQRIGARLHPMPDELARHVERLVFRRHRREVARRRHPQSGDGE